MISWVLVALLGWLAGMLINYISDVYQAGAALQDQPVCTAVPFFVD
jgi:hypothetical protein